MSLDGIYLKKVVKNGIKYFLINILFPSFLLLFAVGCVFVIPVGNFFLKSPVMQKYDSNEISCDKISKHVRNGEMNYFGYHLSGSMFGTKPESTLMEYENSLGYKLSKCNSFTEQERANFCNKKVKLFVEHHLNVKIDNNESMSNYKKNKNEYESNSIIPKICKKEVNLEINNKKLKIKPFKVIKGKENTFIEFGQGIVELSTVALMKPVQRISYMGKIYEVCLISVQGSFCKKRYTIESANVLYDETALVLANGE
jgi:hypothetical protein